MLLFLVLLSLVRAASEISNTFTSIDTILAYSDGVKEGFVWDLWQTKVTFDISSEDVIHQGDFFQFSFTGKDLLYPYAVSSAPVNYNYDFDILDDESNVLFHVVSDTDWTFKAVATNYFDSHQIDGLKGDLTVEFWASPTAPTGLTTISVDGLQSSFTIDPLPQPPYFSLTRQKDAIDFFSLIPVTPGGTLQVSYRFQTPDLNPDNSIAPGESFFLTDMYFVNSYGYKIEGYDMEQFIERDVNGGTFSNIPREVAAIYTQMTGYTKFDQNEASCAELTVNNKPFETLCLSDGLGPKNVPGGDGVVTIKFVVDPSITTSWYTTTTCQSATVSSTCSVASNSDLTFNQCFTTCTGIVTSIGLCLGLQSCVCDRLAQTTKAVGECIQCLGLYNLGGIPLLGANFLNWLGNCGVHPKVYLQCSTQTLPGWCSTVTGSVVSTIGQSISSESPASSEPSSSQTASSESAPSGEPWTAFLELISEKSSTTSHSDDSSSDNSVSSHSSFPLEESPDSTQSADTQTGSSVESHGPSTAPSAESSSESPVDASSKSSSGSSAESSAGPSTEPSSSPEFPEPSAESSSVESSAESSSPSPIESPSPSESFVPDESSARPESSFSVSFELPESSSETLVGSSATPGVDSLSLAFFVDSSVESSTVPSESSESFEPSSEGAESSSESAESPSDPAEPFTSSQLPGESSSVSSIRPASSPEPNGNSPVEPSSHSSDPNESLDVSMSDSAPPEASVSSMEPLVTSPELAESQESSAPTQSAVAPSLESSHESSLEFPAEPYAGWYMESSINAAIESSAESRVESSAESYSSESSSVESSSVESYSLDIRSSSDSSVESDSADFVESPSSFPEGPSSIKSSSPSESVSESTTGSREHPSSSSLSAQPTPIDSPRIELALSTASPDVPVVSSASEETDNPEKIDTPEVLLVSSQSDSMTHSLSSDESEPSSSISSLSPESSSVEPSSEPLNLSSEVLSSAFAQSDMASKALGIKAGGTGHSTGEEQTVGVGDVFIIVTSTATVTETSVSSVTVVSILAVTVTAYATVTITAGSSSESPTNPVMLFETPLLPVPLSSFATKGGFPGSGAVAVDPASSEVGNEGSSGKARIETGDLGSRVSDSGDQGKSGNTGIQTQPYSGGDGIGSSISGTSETDVGSKDGAAENISNSGGHSTTSRISRSNRSTGETDNGSSNSGNKSSDQSEGGSGTRNSDQGSPLATITGGTDGTSSGSSISSEVASTTGVASVTGVPSIIRVPSVTGVPNESKAPVSDSQTHPDINSLSGEGGAQDTEGQSSLSISTSHNRDSEDGSSRDHPRSRVDFEAGMIHPVSAGFLVESPSMTQFPFTSDIPGGVTVDSDKDEGIGGGAVDSSDGAHSDRGSRDSTAKLGSDGQSGAVGDRGAGEEKGNSGTGNIGGDGKSSSSADGRQGSEGEDGSAVVDGQSNALDAVTRVEGGESDGLRSDSFDIDDSSIVGIESQTGNDELISTGDVLGGSLSGYDVSSEGFHSPPESTNSSDSLNDHNVEDADSSGDGASSGGRDENGHGKGHIPDTVWVGSTMTEGDGHQSHAVLPGATIAGPSRETGSSGGSQTLSPAQSNSGSSINPKRAFLLCLVAPFVFLWW